MGRRTERRQVAEALRRIPLFAECDDRELERIDRLMTEVRVRPGQVLIGRGSAALEFMIVREGYGRVCAGEREIGRVGPGSHVGEHSFRGQAWNSTITSLTPMTLLVLNAGELEALLTEVPSLRRRMTEESPSISAPQPQSTSPSHPTIRPEPAGA